jgi:hypothetical protein
MVYRKPELMILTDALTAIQGTCSIKVNQVSDGHPGATENSAGAYEADE